MISADDRARIAERRSAASELCPRAPGRAELERERADPFEEDPDRQTLARVQDRRLRDDDSSSSTRRWSRTTNRPLPQVLATGILHREPGQQRRLHAGRRVRREARRTRQARHRRHRRRLLHVSAPPTPHCGRARITGTVHGRRVPEPRYSTGTLRVASVYPDSYAAKTGYEGGYVRSADGLRQGSRSGRRAR